MENLIEVVSVPIIVSIVYGALALYKHIVDGKEKFIKIIPVIAAVLGVVLSIIAFYAAPAIIAADNIFTAILIGGASGLAATGTNQIFKQLIQKNEADKIKEDDADDGTGKSNSK